jgi:hypothetical protein
MSGGDRCRRGFRVTRPCSCRPRGPGLWRRLCRAAADLADRAGLHRLRNRRDRHQHLDRYCRAEALGRRDRHSRRRLLLAAALLMMATGVGFALTTAFWPLLVIALVGTMNPTSGDASIFGPLEQTVLTQTVEPRRRTALLARYSLIGSVAGALGVLAADQISEGPPARGSRRCCWLTGSRRCLDRQLAREYLTGIVAQVPR